MYTEHVEDATFLDNFKTVLFLFFVSEDCSSVHGKGLILNVEEKAVAGRIFSLHWLSSDNLLSCGPNGILEMWKLGE